ncbi:carbohydrate esterase, Family 12 YesY [Streptomyces himastatinicus ATCC 53653]|uniref:Carbohydrate esterase, Family 12 YesY n=1 Tax=Streptomyces himastatinicus ATCC 53653 TaxID=457427 RepID=D9WC54_9ACTN|nr:rhamnogalacturonan acetylesterase [Streptomyces himastatinicus]EFL27102.1 carbohydrate esterase, Family 12 YesY [Streptomyces himastatinicus ATCC 53653]
MALTRRRAAASLAALPLALAAPGTATASAPQARSQNARTTVYLAGDSTAATKQPTAAPETGWGMALPFFLADDRFTVANHAVNGRSSKSFYDEGRLAPILAALRPGDLLLVQFGHNDEKIEDPARGTDPQTTYPQYLRLYLDGARERGARPVLLTSVERRKFDAAGTAQPTHGAYPDAVRRLARAERVPLLDIQASSIALWQRLGPEATQGYFNWLEPGESPNYPDGLQDNTHFQPHGAIEVARLVARELAAQQVKENRATCGG